MKVMLLYASFGDGHKQVANALEEAFIAQQKAEVIHVDTYRQTSRMAAAFNEWLYELLTRFFPILYGLSYDLTKNVPSGHWLWKLLSVFSRQATWRAVLEHHPDVVVQLFPDQSLDKMPPTLLQPPLVCVVLTDYDIHSRWFHPNVQQYILPANHSQSTAVQKCFVSSTSTNVCGIPIRSQFLFCNNRIRIRGPYILLSAGGRGLFPNLSFVLRELVRIFPNHAVVVMCGRNQNMLHRVRAFARSSPPLSRVIPLEYTTDVASWIQQADFVVAKAGGVSIAECVASGTPMLFYKPQSGQEFGNAKMIAEMGAGLVAKSKRAFIGALRSFEGTSLLEMRNACIQIGKPDAAFKAVKTVSDTLDTYRRKKEG